MTFTVTASLTNGWQDAEIKVWVITGGTEAGGTVNVALNYGTPEFSFTPGGSGSVIVLGVYGGQDNTGITPAAGNTVTDSSSGGAEPCWMFAHYTGTVTEGTPVTLGGSDGNEWNSWGAYEVLSAGSAAIDSSTPAAAGTGSSSTTSPSFAPPAGAVLVAVVTAIGTGTQAVTISDTSGLGLTWTQRGTTQSSGYTGTAAVFTATVPGGGGADADAGDAAGTGAAENAVAGIGPAAGDASGSGAALGASAGPGVAAATAAGTGAALAASAGVSPPAGLASGAGAAPGPVPGVSPGAGGAAGTGAALGASVSTSGNADADAGAAAGSGSALVPGVMVSVLAGLAAGSGSALAPGPGIAIPGGVAGGDGAALGAAVSSSGTSASAGLAAGYGLALGASVIVPAVKGTGSWWGLHSVYEESRVEYDAYWSRPPLDCPFCGQPLVNAPSSKAGSGTELYCNYAGDHTFRWPRDREQPVRIDSGQLGGDGW